MWVRQNASEPTVGSSNPFIYGADPESSPLGWSPTELSGVHYALRVTAVPTPASAAVLACAAGLTFRRRR